MDRTPPGSVSKDSTAAESRGLGDAGVGAIVEACSLTKLRLWMCTSVTEAGLKTIAAKCTQLTSLDLSYVQVTDTALEEITRGLPQLRSLNLDSGAIRDSDNLRLSRTGLDALFRLEHLTKLSLARTGEGYQIVTDEWLEQWSVGRTALEDLCVQNCEDLSQRSLRRLLKNWTNLRKLDFHGCDLGGFSATESFCCKVIAAGVDY